MMNDPHNHDVSKMSRRTMRHADIPLTYQETIGKRGVGVLVDECRRTIAEHNEMRRSQSPYRAATGGAGGGLA